MQVMTNKDWVGLGVLTEPVVAMTYKDRVVTIIISKKMYSNVYYLELYNRINNT